MMPMYFFHPADLLLIPAIILAMWAQYKVSSAYKKYSRIPVQRRISGAQVAEWILRSEGINDIALEPIPGEMTDHYDPSSKTVRLSEEVFYGHSIASVGIAAHELGHVIQDARGYAPMQLRQLIYPVANIGSTLAFPLIFLGVILSYSGLYLPWLIKLGIYMFSAAVAFTIITLPVEFNASRRALKVLSDGRLLTTEELDGVREVLRAAALTYVAAAATAVLQLIRLLMIFRER